MRLFHSIPCGLLAILSVATMPAGAAQSGITTNEYQINSGRYVACCGIAGPIVQQLPNSEQASVRLIIDHGSQSAQMLILGLDTSVAHELKGGRVQAGYIEFGMPGFPGLPPHGGGSVLHYIVSNTAAGLRFNGRIEEPTIGADMFSSFTHSNVVATPIHIDPPPLTIRVSEVKICWPSIQDQNYLVEYFPAATGSGWAPLGPPVTGNGTTNCVSDSVTPGEVRRLYRVLVAP